MKDASIGKYNKTIDIEIDGMISQEINDSAFYFHALGFSEHITVLLDKPLLEKLPSDKLSSVSLYGHFDNFGNFHLKAYRTAKYRVIKYIISFIGFLIFLVIFFKEWKLTRRGFESA